jgi:hypothetical protein
MWLKGLTCTGKIGREHLREGDKDLPDANLQEARHRTFLFKVSEATSGGLEGWAELRGTVHKICRHSVNSDCGLYHSKDN